MDDLQEYKEEVNGYLVINVPLKCIPETLQKKEMCKFFPPLDVWDDIKD